jgi:hypothetical protein
MDYFYNIDGAVVKVDDLDISIMKQIKQYRELTLFDVYPRTLEMYIKCLKMGQQHLIEVTKLRRNDDLSLEWEVRLTEFGRNVLLVN